MRVYAATDVGVTREINQDCIYYSIDEVGELPNLFIVADGMGGHKAGDIASRYTVDNLVNKIKKSDNKDVVSMISEAINEINTEVLQKASECKDYEGMGTTVVVSTIINGMITVANVGDSRLYVIGEDITQITRDHSLVEEMVSNGEINRQQARNHKNKNIITRAIGGEKYVQAEMFLVELKPEDKVLMCSDGLTNMIEDKDILRIIKSSSDIQEAVRTLLDTANAYGGKDNISIILIEQ